MKKEGSREGGRLDPSPSNLMQPLRFFTPYQGLLQDKSPRPLATPVECVEPTEEGRREWAMAELSKLAGPAPDWHPWLKAGLTRRQWLRKERQERLDARMRGEDLLSSKAG